MRIRRGTDSDREVVVITGASAGVGRATVREFAKRGARIGLLARGRQRLETTAAEVGALGGRAIVCPCDVADHEQVEAAANRVEAELGPMEIWINNAMVSVFSPVKDTPPAEFARVTSVTYLGAVHGTLAALSRMLPRNRGTIVQVGSALAYRSIPLQSAYCAAKHALHGFTESLRCELLHDRSAVHLTEVHLPAVNTPQFDWTKSRLPRKAQPVPPIFQPEVAARAIVWAALERRREVKLGWPTQKAILADKLAPALVDRYLATVGYESQQSDELAKMDRPSNLFDSVPGDFAAHGSFDAVAKRHSAHFWALRHRRLITGAVLIALGASLALRNRDDRGSDRRRIAG
jgi:NAD(P)-dependent dehydrogenase (short-subunit alcohol dehydrogenase family)